jgi:hypothetical protein
MRRYALSIFLLAALLAGGLLAPFTAAAQSSERCFAETGQCVVGPIRAYWERNGGLAVFGYPISAERDEIAEDRVIRVQWFERDRLEIQADGTITAGRLGARFLELTGRPWQRGQPAPCIGRIRSFAETGHQICGAMLDYWERNGGLERFGYPITGVIEERIEGKPYQVQYFERRRMEYHPELGGTPYFLQLGLLGRAIYTAEPCPQAPTDGLQRAVRAYLPAMGCPSDQGRGDRAIAWQRYERGVMYWIDASSSAPPMIFVIINDDAAQRSTWQARTDTFRDGDIFIGEAPPDRIAPARGFGKLWWNDGGLRDALGWPIEAEQNGTGAAIAFNSGGWMFERASPNLIVVMQPDGAAFGVRANILPG